MSKARGCGVFVNQQVDWFAQRVRVGESWEISLERSLGHLSKALECLGEKLGGTGEPQKVC